MSMSEILVRVLFKTVQNCRPNYLLDYIYQKSQEWQALSGCEGCWVYGDDFVRKREQMRVPQDGEGLDLLHTQINMANSIGNLDHQKVIGE